MDNYFPIKNLTDIETFIEKTNALHDGYIISVEYQNNGIKISDNAYEFNFELTQLTIRVLITSIFDATLEMVFENISEWKITESGYYDIFEACVVFNDKGFIVWSDDEIDLDKLERNDSYVIAEKMKWRIL